MGCNERFLCLSRNVPEAFFGKVGNIDDDAEVFTFLQNLKTEIRKSLIRVIASADTAVSFPTERENTHAEFIESFES